MFPDEMGQRHTVSRLGLSASAGMFFTQPKTTPPSSPLAMQEDATDVLPHTEQLTSFHQPNDKCSTKTPPRHTASGHNHAPVGGVEGRIGQQSSEESERLLLGVAAAAWKGSRGRPKRRVMVWETFPAWFLQKVGATAAAISYILVSR